jgi:tight adherence protein C
MSTREFEFYNHLPHLLAIAFGLGILVCAYKCIEAYNDAIKLDIKERFLARSLLDPLVEKYMPKSEIVVHNLRMNLQQAGLRGDNAMQVYVRWRVSGVAVAVAIIVLLVLTRSSLMSWAMYGGLSGLFGVLGPDVYLDRLKRERQARIAEALPSLMDLMVLCLDVGLSVEAAFERVTQEMRSLHPLMAEEAALMVREIGAGLTFPQALKRMAERIGVEDLLTLARLISQASQLGASVSTALREYSDASMTKRTLNLEERAGKIGSMMVLPITLCLLPATMVALLGPAVLSLMHTLSKV